MKNNEHQPQVHQEHSVPNLDDAERLLNALDQQGKAPAEPESVKPQPADTDKATAAPNKDGKGSDGNHENRSEQTGPLDNDAEEVKSQSKPAPAPAEPTEASKSEEASKPAEQPAKVPKVKAILEDFRDRERAWEDDPKNNVRMDPQTLVERLQGLSSEQLKGLTPDDVVKLPDAVLIGAGKGLLKRLPDAARKAWTQEANEVKAAVIELTPEDIHELAVNNPVALDEFSHAHLDLMSQDTLKAYESHRDTGYKPGSSVVRSISRAVASLNPTVAKERAGWTEARNENAEADAQAAHEKRKEVAKSRTITEEEAGEGSMFVGLTDDEIFALYDNDEAFNALTEEDQKVLVKLEAAAEERNGYLHDLFEATKPEKEKSSRAVRAAAWLGGAVSKAQGWVKGRKASKEEPATGDPDFDKLSKLAQNATKGAEATGDSKKGLKERAKELAQKASVGGHAMNFAAGALSLLPKGIAQLNKLASDVDMDSKRVPNETKRKVMLGAAAGLTAIAAVIGVGNLLLDNQDAVQQGADAAANMSTGGASSSTQQTIETTTATPKPSSSTAETATTTTTPTGTSTPSKAPAFDTPGVDSVETPGGTDTDKPKIPGRESPNNDLKVEFSAKATELQSGSNVWDSSEQFWIDGGFNGSAEDLDKLTDALKDWRLERLGLSEADALTMPPGVKMPMPNPAEIQDLIKQAGLLKS